MINSYLCRLHKITVDNVFQAEQLLKHIYPISWSHLTAAMIFKLPYYHMGRIDIDEIRGVPTVLLVRNIYMTMASAYFQARDRAKVFSGTPSEFVRDHRYGIVKLVTFFNLFHELQTILGPTLIISYEDFKDNPADCLLRVLESLAIPIDEGFLLESVQDGKLENMKGLSVMPAYLKTPLGPADPNNPNSYKVRNGTNKGFQKLFSQEDVTYLGRVIDDLLLFKDYPYVKACAELPTA